MTEDDRSHDDPPDPPDVPCAAFAPGIDSDVPDPDGDATHGHTQRDDKERMMDLHSRPCTLCGHFHRYQHPTGSDGNPHHEASTVACIQNMKPLLPPRCPWCGWYRHGDPNDPVTMRRCAVHLRTDLTDHLEAGDN